MSFRARIQRTVASVGAGAVVLVGASAGVVLMAGAASAHTPTVSADCHGLNVNLASYNTANGGVNTVNVVIDSTTKVDHLSFGTSYANSFAWTTYAAHTYTVAVLAHDDPNGTNGWTKTFTGASTACTTESHSTEPAYTDPTCASPVGHVNIPNVTGAQYVVNGSNVSAGDHTYPAGSAVAISVQATSSQYTLTGNTGPWNHTFAGVPDCSTHVTPIRPTVTQSDCTGPGQQGNGSITVPAQTGVVYRIDGTVRSGSVSLPAGTYHVSAEAANATYTLEGTKAWDLTINPKDCTVTVSPVAPSFVESHCVAASTTPAGPSYTIPATTGVDYFVGASSTPAAAGTYPTATGSSITITAKPQAGYAFSGTQSRTYQHTFDSATDCTHHVTPVAPAVTQAPCVAPGQQGNGQISLMPVTGVLYSVDGGTPQANGDILVAVGSHTVDATPASADYTIDGTKHFDVVIAAKNCTVDVTPLAPSVTQSGCVAGSYVPSTPTYAIPTVAGVDYYQGATKLAAGTYPAAAGTTVTITAVAQTGYRFAAGALTHWDLVFATSPDCTTHVVPIQPSVSQATCTGTPGGVTSGSITIPATTGASYAIDAIPAAAGTYAEAPGTYMVTVTATTGFTLDGTTSWNLTVDAAPNCNTSVTPATPDVSQYVCTETTTVATLTGPTYTIPTTTGVDYMIAGDVVPAGTYDATPGVLTITAVAQSGYEFPAGTTASFDLTVDKAPTCVLGEKFVKTPKPKPSVLPFTGNHLPVGPTVLVAALAMAAGAALMTGGRRRRPTATEPA